MKNNKYTVAIIDDEQICIDTISQSISDEYPELHIVGVALTVQAGKKLILEHQPDLLFIDIEMPGQTGLELLKSINDRITWSMHVVFHNVCENHLLDVLHSSDFDFIVKPYNDNNFRKTMSRFFKANNKTKAVKALEETLTKFCPIESVFIVTTVTGYQMVKLGQIGYFQYLQGKRLWEIVLADQTRLFLKRDTTANDILNYSPSLIQINQHQIINVNYLHTIVGQNCNLLPPFNTGNRLEPISRKFMTILEERFRLI